MFRILRKKIITPYNRNRQMGRMRKDLIISLRRKGIQISNVQINMEQNSVSLKLSMPRE